MYLENPSLWQVDFNYEGFKWLDFNDIDNSVIGFARFGHDHREHLVCVFNFTPQVIRNYKMGTPAGVAYREIFNTDGEKFGGSNVLNTGRLEPVHEPFGFAPHHVTFDLPPLGGVVFKPEDA
jgi:1,4-alpha-glucan branching enzyme